MTTPLVALLPVSPRPLAGEALSSWVARVAARYDLGVADLLRSVLPDMDALTIGQEAAALDARPWREMETALANAARIPPEAIAGLRVSSVAPRGVLAWPRHLIQPWCQPCVAEVFARCGEFHRQAEWMSGAYSYCVTESVPYVRDDRTG